MPHNIVKTIKLNRKTFDHIQGKKFYYSSLICWLTFSVHLSVLALYIYFLFTDFSLNIWWMIGFLLFLYVIIQMFHKLIYKNPIFIINRNKLFYTKTEKFYDLTKCDLDEAFIGKTNFSMTLRLTERETWDSLRENFWYIKYDNELRAKLRPYYSKKW